MRILPFKFRWSFLGSILATISLATSLVILSQHYEGSWGDFAVFLINLPISYVVLVLGHLLGLDQTPYIIYAGIAQWYFVGWLIEFAIKRENSKKHQ